MDIYKSSHPAEAYLTLEYDDELPTARVFMPALSKGEVALLFLKESRPAVYTFSDPFLGATPFTQIPQETGPLGILKLVSALGVVIESRNKQDQINAMRLLEGTAEFDAAVVDQLKSLSASDDPDIALSAIAVLLRAEPSSGIERLGTYLRNQREEPQSIAILSISSELSQINDDKTVPALETLASSNVLSIRLSAVGALRRFKDPRSASALVQRLDDPNRLVRFFAVKALAEIFQMKGDFDPSTPLFESNPEFYTGIWKQWWVKGGGAASAARRPTTSQS
ncbi:MAG: HEAT repeat domain-containing protein [Terracidiphilus sp.]